MSTCERLTGSPEDEGVRAREVGCEREVVEFSQVVGSACV